MTNTIMNWHYPTEIYCGINAHALLLQHCQTLGINKPLFVSDENLLSLETTQALLSSLDALNPILFSDIKPNPTSDNVLAGIAKISAHHCDGVIALGGGSVLDVAKVIALLAHQDCELWDLEDIADNYLRADKQKILPCIALPTTAGTGSEVGRASLIIDIEQQRKRFIFHPNIMPNIVILDAVLTKDLPSKLTAATGMDALAHNLEALCVDRFHPMADGIAMEGLRLIKENLVHAVQDGHDLDARQNLLAAASMGAIAFQKGLGAVHSLSHPIGARYDAHHGLLNAIFMPYVLQFNRTKIEEKMCRLAAYMSLPKANFDGVQNWLLELREQIGIPHTLQEIIVDEFDVDWVADQAQQDPSTPSNPVALDVDKFKRILQASLCGEC